jgi:hypothetical protein
MRINHNVLDYKQGRNLSSLSQGTAPRYEKEMR